jgi:hypothetical protein
MADTGDVMAATAAARVVFLMKSRLFMSLLFIFSVVFLIDDICLQRYNIFCHTPKFFVTLHPN